MRLPALAAHHQKPAKKRFNPPHLRHAMKTASPATVCATAQPAATSAGTSAPATVEAPTPPTPQYSTPASPGPPTSSGAATPHTPAWPALREQLAPLLLGQGLDILHPFCAQRLNSSCPCSGEARPLPTYGREATLAVLVGNSTALWRPFLAWLANDHPARSELPDPLDAYVEASVAGAISQCAVLAGTRHHVRHSHDTGDRFVNVARAAELSGLAYYSRTTHLCWHPTFGPWFALRAVIVLDADYDEGALQQVPLPCPYPELEAAAAQRMEVLMQLPGGREAWQQHWRQWTELRELGGQHTEACYRYSPQQLAYHYTRERSILCQEVQVLQQGRAHIDTKEHTDSEEHTAAEQRPR